MKSKILSFLSLLVMMIVSTSAWADTAVLSCPSEACSVHSDADNIVTLTDVGTKGGIQLGNATIQGVTSMKLSGSREFALNYSSDVTINSVKLYAVTNKDDTPATAGAGSGDYISYGTVNAMNGSVTEIALTGNDGEGLRFSAQCNAVIVVDYTKAADPEPKEWKPIELVLNKAGLLTTEDMTKVDDSYPTISFGVALDATGKAVRVASDSEEAIAIVSGKYHSDHGMNPFSMKAKVPGAVKITAGTCSYGTCTVTVNGTAVGEPVVGDNATKCWKNNTANIATGIYEGEAGEITITTGCYTPYIKIEKYEAPAPGPEGDDEFELKEKVIYNTKFQSDWTKKSASTTAFDVVQTTTDNQELTFTFTDTAIDPEGTNSKFTSDCVTTGYFQTNKSTVANVVTSPLASITKLELVQAATGGTRGITVYVKGDGDADWVELHNKSIATASGEALTFDVNRTNCQIKFGAYNPDETKCQNAYVTSLKISGNVKVAKRTFKDFKVDFRIKDADQAYTVVTPAEGLPEGVTVNPGSYNGGQHGAASPTVTVAVDGPVKFTIGSCQFGGHTVTVKNGSETIATVDNNNGCENGYSKIEECTYDKYVVYTYNNETPATLTFSVNGYCPFFIAEQCEYIPEVTVTYFDTDGKTRIGEEVIDGGSDLAFAYGAADVTVADGKAFRGWFEGTAVTASKVAEGTSVTSDLKLYAKATDIEVATVGSVFNYDLTQKNFYQEDHELIEMTGSYYNNHGWAFGANQTIKVQVAGNAIVNFTLCQFGNAGTIVATDGDGNQVGEPIALPVASDGGAGSISYEGPATTLTLTLTNGGYVHGVKVFNVNELPKKNDAGYYVMKAGDGAGLLTVLANTKSGDKVFLPNGLYDFGETCLTAVPAGVSLIGQSQDGVIIKNTPLVEGIGVTATLMPGGNDYMQDLSIQCSAEKCATPAASRCVTIQDKSTRNVFKNVSLLSGQDTYYSNGNEKQQSYFENCYITGTVDYICGGGDIVFNKTTFYNNERSSADVIVAPSTSADTKWGYVMMDCIIDGDAGQAGKFNVGRDWQGSPAATWLNTEFKIVGSAAGYTNMSKDPIPLRFHEYNSFKTGGEAITGHNLDALLGGSAYTSKLYLSEADAAKYTLANIFADGVYDGVDAWDPAAMTAQAVADASDIDADAAYLVENNGEFVAIIKGSEFDAATYAGMTIRKANAKGGFGEPVVVEELVNTLLTAGNYKIDATITPKEGITVPEALTKYLGGYTAKGTMTGDEKELVIASEEGLLNGYSVKGDAVILKADATVTIEGKTFQVATAEGNTTGKLAITDNGDGSYGVAEAAIIYNNVVVGTVSGMKVYPYKDFEAGTYYLKSVEYNKFFTRGTHDATAWGSHAAVNKYGIPVKFVDNGSGSMIMYAADIYYESADHSIYINNDYCDNGTKGSYEVTYDYSKDAFAIANKNGGYIKAYENDYVDTGAAEPSYWTLVSGEEYEDFLAEDEAATKAAVLAAANVTEEEFATYVTMDVSESYDAKPANGNAWALNKISTRGDSYYNYGTYGAEIYMGYGTYTQTIEDLKPGIYRVNVAALYRSTFAKALKPLAAEGFKSVSDATVTINSSVAQIAPWYTGQEGDNIVPNTTGEFVDNVDKYTKPVLAYVGEDGNMTISVETTSWWWGAWLLFNSIDIKQMVDEHTAADTVQATENAEKQINKYVENGRLVIVDANGMKYNAAGQIVK